MFINMFTEHFIYTFWAAALCIAIPQQETGLIFTFMCYHFTYLHNCRWSWLSVKLPGLSYCLFSSLTDPSQRAKPETLQQNPKTQHSPHQQYPEQDLPIWGSDAQRWKTPSRCVCVCVCVCPTGQASLTLPVALALNPPHAWGRDCDCTLTAGAGCQGWALMVCVCRSRSTDALRPDKWEPYPSLHISPPSHRPFAFLRRLSYATDEQSIESVFELLCSIIPVGDSGSVCVSVLDVHQVHPF